MTLEQLMDIDQASIPDAAARMESSDLPMLVELLNEKNDKLRYQAFQMLQCRARVAGDVYPYWDTLLAKLSSDNSYQRSLGMMLMAENARWDTEGKMERDIAVCLNILNDEKPITVRQGVQALGVIAQAKPALRHKITEKIASIDLSQIRESMRKSIMLDCLRVLTAIGKDDRGDAAEAFIFTALNDGLLDAKSVREIRSRL